MKDLKNLLLLLERDPCDPRYVNAASDFLLKHGLDLLKNSEDAARYQWLRQSADISWNGWCTHSMLIATQDDRDALDTAIDAARWHATAAATPDATPDAGAREGE